VSTVDLSDLEQQIGESDANRPAARRQLVWVLRRVRAMLDRQLVALDDLNDRLDLQVGVIDDRLDVLVGRADALEVAAAKTLTLTVVATVAGLPASASARQWFRVAGDQAVYVGNGAGQPLTKLVPVAV
jgi:hypothetical protein